jgi:uncharacterized protein
MTRMLLLIAIGVIAFLLLRRYLARKDRGTPPAFVPMVSCMSCGLHLPRDAAIERDGRFFCSHEHADNCPR